MPNYKFTRQKVIFDKNLGVLEFSGQEESSVIYKIDLLNDYLKKRKLQEKQVVVQCKNGEKLKRKIYLKEGFKINLSVDGLISQVILGHDIDLRNGEMFYVILVYETTEEPSTANKTSENLWE